MYYIKQNQRFIKADDNLTKAKRQATKAGGEYPAVYITEQPGRYKRIAVKVSGKWS